MGKLRNLQKGMSCTGSTDTSHALVSFSFSKSATTYKKIQQHHRRDDEEIEFADQLLLGNVVNLQRLWVISLLGELGWWDIVCVKLFGDCLVRAVRHDRRFVVRRIHGGRPGG
jgi:hypothetical protein